MTTQKGIIVINIGIAKLLFSSPMDIKATIPIEMIAVPKKNIIPLALLLIIKIEIKIISWPVENKAVGIVHISEESVKKVQN